MKSKLNFNEKLPMYEWKCSHQLFCEVYNLQLWSNAALFEAYGAKAECTKQKNRKKTRKQSVHPNNFENQSNARRVILRLFYMPLCNHAELLFLAVLQNVSSISLIIFFMHLINSAASKTLPAQVKIEEHLSLDFLKFKSADLRRF